MFLPNALPNAVLGRPRTKRPTPPGGSGVCQPSASTVEPAMMAVAAGGRLGKPHRSGSVELIDGDGRIESGREPDGQPRSFVGRSWDRLSGRRRRRKRRERASGGRRNPLPLDEQTPTHTGGVGPHSSTTPVATAGAEAFQFQGWEVRNEAEPSNDSTPSSSNGAPNGDGASQQQQQFPPKSLEEHVASTHGDSSRGPFIRRGMDRLRRSLRIPFHRRRSPQHPSRHTNPSATTTTTTAPHQRHDMGAVTFDSDSGSPHTSTVPTTPPSHGDHPLQHQSKTRGGVSNFARTLLSRSLRVGRAPAQRQEQAAIGVVRLGRGSGGGKGADRNGPAQFDEIAVRSSACSFLVKYLGTCEVFESRGIQVCESALQHLRARKQYTKALLYVSGDAIRVVDQGNSRGLIVDQTIEKVSFCAPDRHNSKGFAYICREGATRRWMCHGFQSMRESGERISHAVGCAFSVCLEKKKKRDAEMAAFKNAQSLHHGQSSRPGGDDLNAAWNESAHAESSPTSSGSGFAQGRGGILINSGGEPGLTTAHRINPAYSSFRRQLSIAERRRDPQTAIVNTPPPPPLPSNGTASTAMTRSVSLGEREAYAVASVDLAISRSRPTGTTNASLLSFEEGSLNDIGGNIHAESGVSIPFRRFNSLGSHNAAQVPACRSLYGIKTLFNEPIYEGDLDESCGNDQPHHQVGALPTAQLTRADTSIVIVRPSAQSQVPTAPVEDSNHQADEWLNEAFHASLHLCAPGTPATLTYDTAASPRATWTSFDADNIAHLKNGQRLLGLENGAIIGPRDTVIVSPTAHAHGHQSQAVITDVLSDSDKPNPSIAAGAARIVEDSGRRTPIISSVITDSNSGCQLDVAGENSEHGVCNDADSENVPSLAVSSAPHSSRKSSISSSTAAPSVRACNGSYPHVDYYLHQPDPASHQRRSIEYQRLEEDVEGSQLSLRDHEDGRKNSPADGPLPRWDVDNGGAGGGVGVYDPFDVRWSAAVLEMCSSTFPQQQLQPMQQCRSSK